MLFPISSCLIISNYYMLSVDECFVLTDSEECNIEVHIESFMINGNWIIIL